MSNFNPKQLFVVGELQYEIIRQFEAQLSRQIGRRSTADQWKKNMEGWSTASAGSYAKDLVKSLQRIRNDPRLLQNSRASIKYIPVFELSEDHSLFNLTKIDLKEDYWLLKQIIYGNDMSFPEIFELIEDRAKILLKVIATR
jgi:hypothetical protein